MKHLFILFFVCIYSSLFAQDTTYTIEDFTIKLKQSHLLVEEKGKTVYEKDFTNPSAFNLDLDNDGVDEFIVNDSKQASDGLSYYTLYIYNTFSSFYLTDSIYSGLKEPYFLFSDEVENVVLVTGSPDFDSLYTPALENVFSPMTCWSYVDSSLVIVNDRLYDIFISENEKNLDFLKTYYNEKGKSCNNTEALRSVIAAIYANYSYADEEAMAERTIDQFYYCTDPDKFRESIKKLL